MCIRDSESSDQPLDELIQRAGSAVAWAARRFLKGSYGKRVVVIYGKGNNGKDGQVAASYLRKWGIKTIEYSVAEAPKQLPMCDLVIDAAYGTGIRGEYFAPSTEAPVIAVDIPSGINGLTGEVMGLPMKAYKTITFQALKPGHLLPTGSNYVGEIEVIDIGLDTSHIKTFQFFVVFWRAANAISYNGLCTCRHYFHSNSHRTSIFTAINIRH